MLSLIRSNLFVCIGLALNLGASVQYLCCGDYARMAYWLSAASLTFIVTFLLRR